MSTTDLISLSQTSSPSLWLSHRADVQRRVNALLNLQAEYFRLRFEFHEKIQQLQCSFNEEFENIFDRRCSIIQNANLAEPEIPDFWLTVLKNVENFDFPVQISDEPCLKYLIDVRCRNEPTGFTLEFHFHPSNPFFVETRLTKSYSICLKFDEENPYRSYDGPEINQCSSSSITWKENRNLTIRKREKRRRNRKTGHVRSFEVEETVQSFFDFFSPPLIPAGGINEMNDDDQIRLDADIQYGLLLKQRVIPRAILYYTGEILPVFDEH